MYKKPKFAPKNKSSASSSKGLAQEDNNQTVLISHGRQIEGSDENDKNMQHLSKIENLVK
jgi:hypothetical protein